jgi:hypothetical protein
MSGQGADRAYRQSQRATITITTNPTATAAVTQPIASPGAVSIAAG